MQQTNEGEKNKPYKCLHIENCRLRTATASCCSGIHSNLNRFIAAEVLHYRNIYKYNYRMRQGAIKTLLID